jgi:competence protein ComEC
LLFNYLFGRYTGAVTQQIQELIDDILAAQKNNLFLWAPFFFAVGIAIYFGLKFEPVFIMGFGCLCLSAIVSFLLFLNRDLSSISKALFLLSLAFCLVLLGFCVAQARSILVHTQMITKKMSPVEVIGNIESIELLSDKEGSRVILHNLEIERLKSGDTPRKIRLKIRQDDDLQKGQRIKILAGLNPPGAPVIPGGFDFQRMSYFEGIGAVGFAYAAPQILKYVKNANSMLDDLRDFFILNIDQEAQNPEKSIIIALMTGQRGAINDSNWDAMRDAGLAHLLAISGLHVGMVAGVLFFFSRLIMASFSRLTLHYPIKKYAAGIALIGAAFYTLMVGAPIPTQRALIMTGFMMVAIMVDRSPFSMRLVAVAALVVLFFTPESLTSVGFQMSFAAVVSLIYFYEVIRPYWRAMHSQAGWVRKVALYFIGVSLTTVIAGAATGVFSLYHFQHYANYGIIANLVAVPLMAFMIMPLIVVLDRLAGAFEAHRDPDYIDNAWFN